MRKSEILDRIMSFYGLRSKTELAHFLGVSPQTVSNWYSRNSIDYDLIFEKCREMDFNLLICGALSPYAKVANNVGIASDNTGSYDVPVLCNRNIPVISSDDGAGLYMRNNWYLVPDKFVPVPENMLGAGDYVAFKTDDTTATFIATGNYVICKRIVDVGGWNPEPSKLYLLSVRGYKLMLRSSSAEKNDPRNIILSCSGNGSNELFPDIKAYRGDVDAVWEVKLAIAPHESGVTETQKRLNELEKKLSELENSIDLLSGK